MPPPKVEANCLAWNLEMRVEAMDLEMKVEVRLPGPPKVETDYFAASLLAMVLVMVSATSDHPTPLDPSLA